MESHPAHAPLPLSARSEALDALTWSYTGQFLFMLLPYLGPLTCVQTVSCHLSDLYHHRSVKMNAKN